VAEIKCSTGQQRALPLAAESSKRYGSARAYGRAADRLLMPIVADHIPDMRQTS
jgi:hypothetical protein